MSEVTALYKSATKAELIRVLEGIDKVRRDEKKQLEEGLLKALVGLKEADAAFRKLEQQRDEWEHLAESVIDGVRQTLNEDTKLYDKHHNTYYALWYWVEWGMKVNNELKKED